MTDYNFKLCEAKHNMSDKEIDHMDKRILKLENRFLAILSVLVANLCSGLVGLGILLSSKF